MAGTLYIMIGIPGSGKSTFAKSHKGKGDIYISRDEIRFSMIGDDEDYFAHENDVYAEFCKQINNAINTALNDGHNVWVDATHITKASRSKLFKNMCHIPENCIGVVMKTPFYQCKKWNFGREGRALVPSNVMNRMKGLYEEPSSDEPFSEILYVYNKGE